MRLSVDPLQWVNIDILTNETVPSPLIVGVVGDFPTVKALIVCRNEWEILKVNLLQRVTTT